MQNVGVCNVSIPVSKKIPDSIQLLHLESKLPKDIMYKEYKYHQLLPNH